MLFAIAPFTLILTSIWPWKHSETIFSIIFILYLACIKYLSNIFSPIAPRETSFPVHLIRFPLANISSSILPHIFPMPMNIIAFKWTVEAGSISPKEGSLSFLLSLDIFPFVFSSVWPNFYPLAMLLIIMPSSFIICSICMKIFTVTFRFIVSPFTLIARNLLSTYISPSAWINRPFPQARSFYQYLNISKLIPLIKWSVIPELHAVTKSFIFEHLPNIYRSVVQFLFIYFF